MGRCSEIMFFPGTVEALSSSIKSTIIKTRTKQQEKTKSKQKGKTMQETAWNKMTVGVQGASPSCWSAEVEPRGNLCSLAPSQSSLGGKQPLGWSSAPPPRPLFQNSSRQVFSLLGAIGGLRGSRWARVRQVSSVVRHNDSGGISVELGPVRWG